VITDIKFAERLFYSGQGHNMWFMFAVYLMICPYFVCSIPYIDY